MEELRLQRICNKNFTEESKALTNQLVKGDNESAIHQQISKTFKIERAPKKTAKPKKPGSIKQNSTNTYT